MVHSCESEQTLYTGRYDVYVIPIVIIAILQLLLFIHTMHNGIVSFCKRQSKNDGGHQTTTKPTVHILRLLYVAMQLLALYWVIGTDVLRYCVDPHFPFIQTSSFWSAFVSYSAYYVPAMIYTLYL